MITSRANKRVGAAVRLKKRALRDRDGRFLVEGVRAVGEALSSGRVTEMFFVPDEERLGHLLERCREAGVPARPVSADVMAHLTSTVTPQGVVAVANLVEVALTEAAADADLAVVLVGVRDPGNVGTILRSADAAGADTVVLTGSSVDVYNPKAVRASAGSLFHVPVVRHPDVGEAVEAFRARGLRVVAASASGEGTVYQTDLTGPTAVMLGSEAWGLPDDVVALADEVVRVPIHRAESLNLAAAATVFLFEAARQRHGEVSALAEVVAGAAHDIRSPLAAIRGFGSTLAVKWAQLTDEQRELMLAAIAYDADRMGVMITQLVDAARLESGSLSLAAVEHDLTVLARTVQGERSRPELPPIEVVGEPVLATVDGDRIKTILTALVEAARWWGEQGPVMIRVQSDGSPVVRVSRAVTALGAEEAESLLRPRAPGTGQGSKVGLYVAKGLAEAHGGTLTVEAGDEVAFVLRLPKVK